MRSNDKDSFDSLVVNVLNLCLPINVSTVKPSLLCVVTGNAAKRLHENIFCSLPHRPGEITGRHASQLTLKTPSSQYRS